jgi:Putative peptidoglycan binding domain
LKKWLFLIESKTLLPRQKDMRKQMLLTAFLGLGLLLGGPLISEADAGHPYYHHNRDRYDNRDRYNHRPNTGLALEFNFGPAPVYRQVRRPSYDYSGNVVADVQYALNRRGYRAGTVDGSLGPQTRRAIRNYQADRGLYVTGSVDRDLLRSLGL